MKRLATTLTIITIVLAIAAATVHAAVVRGRIVDGADTTGMVGATVTLTRHSGKLAAGAATGADGSFALSKVDAGRYIFKVTSVGYEPYSANIVVGRRDTVLPAVTLKPSSIMLAEAVVVGRGEPRDGEKKTPPNTMPQLQDPPQWPPWRNYSSGCRA